MFCAICQHDVPQCTCPDIDARLASLATVGVIAPAVKANIAARAAVRAAVSTCAVCCDHVGSAGADYCDHRVPQCICPDDAEWRR